MNGGKAVNQGVLEKKYVEENQKDEATTKLQTKALATDLCGRRNILIIRSNTQNYCVWGVLKLQKAF